MNTTDHLHTIDVDAPIRVAYDQWTQFEMFPRFMDHVETVRVASLDQIIGYLAGSVGRVVVNNQNMKFLFQLQGKKLGRDSRQVVCFVVGWNYD